MQRRIKWIFGTLVFLSFLLVFLNYFKILSFRDIKNLASIFFVQSITEQQLKNKYILVKNGDNDNAKIKILVVAGHDNDFWGTEFSGNKEADLNLDLAKELSKMLAREKEFEVILLRDENGDNRAFTNYFNQEQTTIKKFQQTQKQEMKEFVNSRLIEEKEGVLHNQVSSEIAQRLYGINKWANENKIDIVIHVHFNDYPRGNTNQVGEYSGLAIYVPDVQYSNAKASIALGKSVFRWLKKYFAISDMPKEKSGVVGDQNLIAVGANNSLDSAALLIEYGYIYESQFMNQEIRPLVLKELARQTYLGIKDFFGATSPNENKNIATPYQWENNLKKGTLNNKNVFALQMALIDENLYPTPGFEKNKCPINGNFKECTETAVKKFQKKYDIEPISGYVGPLTREKLNELY